MIIYQIRNKTTGKSYIGQTTYPTFKKRYSGGRWWDTTNNPLLANAAKKYGIDDFEVVILEKDVESLERLNALEIHYADKFNAYKPNGYNLRGCGDNRYLLPDHIEAIRKRGSRHCTLKKIETGEVINIFNLNEFCRTHNLNARAFSHLIRKQKGIKASQGYCLPETPLEEVRHQKFLHRLTNPVEILCPDGEVISVYDVKAFVTERGLHYQSLVKVLHGDYLCHKGYRLASRRNERHRIAKFNHNEQAQAFAKQAERIDMP